MSTPTSSKKTESENKAKFTRGEKCIYIHLIITFILILILIIIFFIHLCSVRHVGNDVFRITRRSVESEDDYSYVPVGVLYLNVTPARFVCNTLLLSSRWSLTPAHCAAIPIDPYMLLLSPNWRIKYAIPESKYVDTEIKRSIPHPDFSSEDFKNNIGLIQHVNPVFSFDYVLTNTIITNDEFLKLYERDTMIIAWKNDFFKHKHFADNTEPLKSHIVRPVLTQHCVDYLSPIVELRSNEFCVASEQDDKEIIDHGAVLVVYSKILGIFSWGDKEATRRPMVILQIEPFKSWIENIISL